MPGGAAKRCWPAHHRPDAAQAGLGRPRRRRHCRCNCGRLQHSARNRSRDARPRSARRLEAQGLQKSYGVRKVVKDVHLAVQAGEVVGLLGPNGAGKTTSFYMIVGLVRA